MVTAAVMPGRRFAPRILFVSTSIVTGNDTTFEFVTPSDERVLAFLDAVQ